MVSHLYNLSHLHNSSISINLIPFFDLILNQSFRSVFPPTRIQAITFMKLKFDVLNFSYLYRYLYLYVYTYMYLLIHTVAVIILCVHSSKLICYFPGHIERLHFQASWGHVIEFWPRILRSRIVRISGTDLFISRLSSRNLLHYLSLFSCVLPGCKECSLRL